jgi:16S rRNA (cytosine967-C5)-methyltransferase
VTGNARTVALDALRRIDEGGYANLVLPPLLASSGLEQRDRAFATELVYGATRMRRACDWAVDRFTRRDLEPLVRDVLRLGAYQLIFLGTPPHAAVSATVDLAPAKVRGLVNAVLRKVCADLPDPEGWPSLAVRLSYPDWIVDRLVDDLGRDRAVAALEQMNQPAEVDVRADEYVQDRASQMVAAYVGAQAGERVLDVAASPGGKATAMGQSGAFVVANDVRPHRARLVAGNVRRLGYRDCVAVTVADGRALPMAPGRFDRVLLDAPCSGLGVLRRRPDARWRVSPSDVRDLSRLQRDLIAGCVGQLRPGGTFVYSVCTLTLAESAVIDNWMAATYPHLRPVPHPGPPWEAVGRGARLLPQTAGTDGMFVLGLRAAS